MKRSTDRILTTHTGSLPRPPDLATLIQQRENREPVDPEAFKRRVASAVVETVRHQVESGIDSVSDGEEGKPGYSTYIKDRVTGFDGESRQQLPTVGEARDFPEFAERRAAATALRNRPTCNGPIAWKDFGAVETDVANLAAAAKQVPAAEYFMTAASPGVISVFLSNDYYPNDDAYLEALAAVMKDEYNAITRAGFVLQLDAPQIAMSRNNRYAQLSSDDYHSLVDRHIAVTNEATKDIDPEQMRIHLCWGNYEGPHHTDVPLREIIGGVLKSRANGISFEGANPRHEHEWNVWKDVKLPDEKVIYPGVIDSTTNFVEHPELVAQRIVRYAEVVGRERVVASSDCGFGTFSGSNMVDARVAWAKLKTLAEGAALASKELWLGEACKSDLC